MISWDRFRYPKPELANKVTESEPTANANRGKSPIIEVCVEGIEGLLAAQKAGADRAELCAALVEGGITPSLGTVREALRVAEIPFHVIVRPRGGDFLYSEAEFRSMLEDIGTLRDMGVAGVVIGYLNTDGSIDEARTRASVDAAGSMSVTCHRAFDMASDVEEAVAALIRCGVTRVLTSGQEERATDGINTLSRIVQLSGDDLIVMACGELDAGGIAGIRDQTGVPELHFAALRDEESPMTYRNTRIGMGGTDFSREYRNTVTDIEAARQIIAAARH